MIQIEQPGKHRYALHHLGFRPFFLLGGLFAVIAVALWAWLFHRDPSLLPAEYFTTISWHAHEMVYGYAMAAVAGFLLTAVRNWTSVQTVNGAPLLMLAGLWAGARAMPFIDHPYALMAMVAMDLTFNAWLCWAILYPIMKVKQWQHMGIWVKLLLLLISNGLFYMGLTGVLADGVQWGIYSGLYLILSLVMLMGRRVIPFFIEKGVEESFIPTNHRWVDLSSLVLVLLFWLVAVFLELPTIAALLALALAALHTIRLLGWYTPGIWKKTLLWVLYLGYGWIVAGFLLYGLSHFLGINNMPAVHAFAYGGIGMITLGMITRVSLGHTGRDVFNPPKYLGPVFALLMLGALLRVLPPLIDMGHFALWIGLSQGLWIAAFTIFVIGYGPMLIKARVDGRYG